VEVKASATPTKRDFRGLTELRGSRGKKFLAGVVIHCGEQTLPFGDRMWAVPVPALWQEHRILTTRALRALDPTAIVLCGPGADTPGAVNLVRKIREVGFDAPLYGFRASQDFA
jgi:hypothetical protein